MARHMVTVETVTVKRWSRKAAARRRVGTGDTSKTLMRILSFPGQPRELGERHLE